jgi:hypothetical protein
LARTQGRRDSCFPALHPQSANAFDSLREAYLESGDKPQAIANYEKSLALDSTNNNAVRQLKKLRATSD